MAIISRLICEKELPIPWEDFSEEENEVFKKIQWDEQEFYTSSFYDADIEEFSVATYTISEDGLFYRARTKIEWEIGDEGHPEPKDKGEEIERQDFTGEIAFSTEILEDKYDYEISFVALFFKGELKELNKEVWDKRDNSKRKKALNKISETMREEELKRKSFSHKIGLPFRIVLNFITSIVKWVLFKIFSLVVRIETWNRE